MQIIKSIQNRIYELIGERVMLDFDLAAFYEVKTRVLNQPIKRNIKGFLENFMFRLSSFEWQDIQSQIVIATKTTMSSQIVITYPNTRPNTALWKVCRKSLNTT